LIISELDGLKHYPDNRYADFRRAAAEFVGLRPEQIVPGNGSSEIIRLFAETVLEDDDLALVPKPTFGEYESQARLMGASTQRVGIDPAGVPRFDDGLLRRAAAAFLCNPNNPTGRLLPRGTVEEMARRCERLGTYLLVDEAFIELSDPDQSVISLAPEMEHLVVMRSLTKCFGVPGLRLGFGAANENLARVMDTARIPWSISSIAASAGAYLFGHAGYLEESRALIRAEIAWLAEHLTALGLKPHESQVNFILVEISGAKISSQELCERTERQGVLIRDCQSFGLGDGYIRVAVRNRAENEMLISALEKAILEKTTQWKG
ncbi:MAG TPA: histidinol-phosphate transaminase, partial [Methanotrichaceae archaeon]|nr:histidinol-phosphate transaminase [Methanotrichaceae archaeon]